MLYVERGYGTCVRWTLKHPWAIIATSLLVFAMTFPLNAIVGRTFVPNEDMGEFTVHLDTPQGTSLEGTTEIARDVVKEIWGTRKGVSAERAVTWRVRIGTRISTCSFISFRRTSGRSRPTR